MSSVIALLLWNKEEWRNIRKTHILGILQGLVPFGGRAWETVDQLLVDVGSRTITQWHCMCESAGGIRESHVFVESTLPRVTAKDEEREKGVDRGTRGHVFREIKSWLHSRPQDEGCDFIIQIGNEFTIKLPADHFLLRHNVRCIRSSRCIHMYVCTYTRCSRCRPHSITFGWLWVLYNCVPVTKQSIVYFFLCQNFDWRNSNRKI